MCMQCGVCTGGDDFSLSLQPRDVLQLKAEALSIEAATALNLEQVSLAVGVLQLVCSALPLPFAPPPPHAC